MDNETYVRAWGATVLHYPEQVRSSGESKEAETFKVCQEIHDLASDLLRCTSSSVYSSVCFLC